MFSKAFTSFSVLFFLIPAQAFATGNAKLKKVQVQSDARAVNLELTFDKPMAAYKIKPAFERNFVQFALKGTVMDQARILPAGAEQKILDKVFAYPYSADTVRVRMIASGKEKWEPAKVAKNITVKNLSARVVRIQLASASAEAAPAPAAPAVAAAPAKAEATAISAAEKEADKEILKEVMTNTKEIDIRDPDAIKTAIIQQPQEGGPIGLKAEPSRGFLRMALSLIAVLAVFGGVIVALKKYGVKRLPFGKKERIIQVVATHYLGNKQSISLVKVAGEYMVVGTSSEGVQLISKLGPEINVDKYLEDRFWGGTFENHLKTYSKDMKVTKQANLEAYDGVRDVAGVAAPKASAQPAIPARASASPRAITATRAAAITAPTDQVVPNVRSSIKEKLSKLKPLT